MKPMKTESEKIQKLLISSDRVTEARSMLGLKKNEYLVSVLQGQIIIGASGKKKTRTVKELNGQSATLFLMGTVIPHIQEKIVDYFDLPIKPLQHVLMKRHRFLPYDFEVNGGEKTIKITFIEKLNEPKLQHLFKQITEWNSGLFKEPCEYQQVEPIEFFDEKFALRKKYLELKKQHPKGIPPKVSSALVAKAKELLGKKRDYTSDDFRSTISGFKKTFLG